MSFTIYCHNDELLYIPIERVFGIGRAEREMIRQASKGAWDRCLYCFRRINNPKFQTGGIQPYHSVQYGMYLYFLSNEIYRKYGVLNDSTAEIICDKIFMVNMSFTGMDIYYGHKMPDVFLPTHTSGVVFSPEAKIGDYFMFAHGSNIGMNGGKAPIIGNHVVMFGNAKIIGSSHVGDYVVFGANTYVKDMDIPDHSLVFGQYPDVIVKNDRKNLCGQILSERFCLDS